MLHRRSVVATLAMGLLLGLPGAMPAGAAPAAPGSPAPSPAA